MEKELKIYGEVLLEAVNHCGEEITLLMPDECYYLLAVGPHVRTYDVEWHMEINAMVLSLDAEVDRITWASWDMLDLADAWNEESEYGCSDLVLKVNEYFEDLGDKALLQKQKDEALAFLEEIYG